MSANNSSTQLVLTSLLCFDSIIGNWIFASLSITYILLLPPLSVFVLILGFQRWKRQRSVTSAFSFSDIIAYNMAVMELIGTVGFVLIICSFFVQLSLIPGLITGAFPWAGQVFFPVLTCVDRYLAVVHPITYMRLRQGAGVRIRSISIVFVWCEGFVTVGYVFAVLRYPQYSLIMNSLLFLLLLIATTYCSLSVLCILIRPKPGEAGHKRARVDQSKQKAFNTIIIIMGVLLFKFGGNLVCNMVGFSPTVSHSVQCLARVATGWFNLPSSLVLLLLFVHNAGKLPGCKTQH